MARRGHGEGSIRKRADGRWEALLTLEGGKRKSFYGKTRQEVARRLAQAQHDLQQGLPMMEERQTVEDFLTSWLETMRPPKLRHETWERYHTCVVLHINPSIGRVRLAHLSAQHVQHLYAQCLGAGLSSTTVRHVHAVLHRALESAVRLGLVGRNVSDMVDAPRKRPFEMHVLTRDEAQRFLQAVKGDRLEALFVLALATGMRLGELLALRWREIDLEAGWIRVVATLKQRERQYVFAEPKSRRSRRQIAITTPVLEVLRRHRHRQRMERLAAGAAWQELDMVFSDEIGGPLPDGQVRRRHVRIVRTAGLPSIRFHDLRHTCATLLLAQRVNPKVVSEMLGHSTVSITLDIYSHVLPDMQQDAAEAIAIALGW